MSKSQHVRFCRGSACRVQVGFFRWHDDVTHILNDCGGGFQHAWVSARYAFEFDLLLQVMGRSRFEFMS